MTAEIVTSAQNPRLKLVRKLATRRGRLREGAFAVEGEDLVEAGIRAGWAPRMLVCNGDEPPAASFHALVGEGAPTLFVTARLLGQVAELAHPPRVIGVFDLPEDVTWEGATSTAQPLLYLDGVRDPGNLGSALRSANAIGVARVGLGPGSADPYSPKATRASMGAIFEVASRAVDGIDDFAPAGARVVALDAAGDVPLHEVDLGDAPVLCIGSERVGIGDEVRRRADVLARIPQRDDVDSLNAAAAAAIVLYEWQRQRMTGSAR